MELSYTTSQIALEESQAILSKGCPDFDNLTVENYKEQQEHYGIIHEALVVLEESLSALYNLKDNVNNAPELNYASILEDPRGLFSQLWCLRCYLGNWRCKTDCEFGENKFWGEINKVDI